MRGRDLAGCLRRSSYLATPELSRSGCHNFPAISCQVSGNHFNFDDILPRSLSGKKSFSFRLRKRAHTISVGTTVWEAEVWQPSWEPVGIRHAWCVGLPSVNGLESGFHAVDQYGVRRVISVQHIFSHQSALTVALALAGNPSIPATLFLHLAIRCPTSARSTDFCNA